MSKKKGLTIAGVLCFVIVVGLLMPVGSNYSAINQEKEKSQPWKELHHCVSMRIGNHDEADMIQMQRYYEILEANPYIYASLSANEQDFFSADESVLYRNVKSSENIIKSIKNENIIYFILIVIFLLCGIALLIYSKRTNFNKTVISE